MANLSTLRGSLGEVEFLLLNCWTPFQRDLFSFYRETDDPSAGAIEHTPLPRAGGEPDNARAPR